MGHAMLTNISQCASKLLRNRETVSIKEVVDELEKNNEGVHASEGEYKERHMLSMGCEDVFNFLLKCKSIEPVNPNKKQAKILREWQDEDPERDISNWDCGDDGEGGEYAILDSVRWRAIKKKIPLLHYITH